MGKYCYESGSHLHTDRQQPPQFSYFDKYVFIVRVPSFCLMGISCVHCKLLYSQVYYIYNNNNNNGTIPH